MGAIDKLKLIRVATVQFMIMSVLLIKFINCIKVPFNSSHNIKCSSVMQLLLKVNLIIIIIIPPIISSYRIDFACPVKGDDNPLVQIMPVGVHICMARL